MFLPAAREDELVASPQLFAAEQLVGTSASELHKAIAPGCHLGLFVARMFLSGLGRGLPDGSPKCPKAQPSIPPKRSSRQSEAGLQLEARSATCRGVVFPAYIGA
jgi:hypothetical protein